MDWISKLFGGGVANIVDSVFKGIDSIEHKDERIKLRAQLEMALQAMKTQIIESRGRNVLGEINGNWLQRSWRPILALSFGFVVLYSKFAAPAFKLPNTELEPEFWQLLMVMVGGYTIGRSAEKITIGRKMKSKDDLG